MTSDASDPPSADTSARFVVTGGGEPDPEQLAALVVALTPAPAASADPGPPGWRRAALLEGVGGASVLAPSDLDVAMGGHRERSR